MWRSSLTTTAAFRSSTSLLAKAASPEVETVARPVPSHLRSIIKDTDLVGVFGGEYRLFRARPEHIVLLKGPMGDFMLNEPCCIALNAKPNDEILWPFLYNCTRYPFSFFALNGKDEIVNIILQDVAYYDNSKDPLPRMDMVLTNPKDPFFLMAAVLGWAEQRFFERFGVEKLLNNEVVFVPTVHRRKKISGLLYPPAMKESVDLAAKYGLKWNVGVTTRTVNAKHVAKLGFVFPERIPEEVHKDFDGNPWRPYGGEPYGGLCYLDMDLAREKKTFG